MAPSSVPLIQLNDGNKIPVLGLGTWQSPKGQVYDAVTAAIEAGFRHFDCAYVYQNEEEIGSALSDAIKSGKVKREDLFVTTKCWLTFYSSDRVEKCLKRSLQKLQLDYVDLYLIHWPIGFRDDDDNLFPDAGDGNIATRSDIDYTDTWKGMEDVKSKGLAKSIGISNFTIEQIDNLLKTTSIVPSMNQIELHPLLTQKYLVNYCQSKGIGVTAYCPLGSSPVAAAKPGHSGIEAERPSLLNDPRVNAIAEKYGKTSAQVLIKYHVQQGVICIPKSVTKERIIQNMAIFDFQLSPEDINQLDNMNTGYRFCKFNVQGLSNHPNYPFKGENLD